MKKKIKYSNEKIGTVEVIKDFLPKPVKLVLKKGIERVTINLSKKKRTVGN